VRDAYLRSSIWSTVLATASMVLVSGVVVLVSGVWIVGRPLGQLADKANRVGRGDLTGPLALAQRDEIGELAREVNAMCERLVEANSKSQRETLARIAALEQLRHADRLITVGRLAAGIAHELGTPLNVIGGRVKMLRRKNVQPSVADEYHASTRRFASSGSQRSMGSSRRTVPSSTSSTVAAAAIGLVSDAMRKIASRHRLAAAGLPGAEHLDCTSAPRAMSATRPGTSPRSQCACSAARSRGHAQD
jgi:signal transduction histidine kinase